MKKRVFSAKFKADLVLEVIKGEKELNLIATESNITPNQLRNWKKEFIEKSSNVFDNKKDEKLKEALAEASSENEKLYTKVGRLTTENDWLKKKADEILGSDWENDFASRTKRKK